MGGGAEILELLAGEDVQGDKMDLGVAVLAGLRGGHVHDLARPALDHDVATSPKQNPGSVPYRIAERPNTDPFLRAEHCIGKVNEAPALA